MLQFICLFVVFRPSREFFFIWSRHNCLWRSANFDLCSALVAIEQWGFFSVPHLLWHGASVYNCHLLGPVTLTPIAECLAELSLPFFHNLGLLRLAFEQPTFRLQGQRPNPLRNMNVPGCKLFQKCCIYAMKYQNGS